MLFLQRIFKIKPLKDDITKPHVRLPIGKTKQKNLHINKLVVCCSQRLAYMPGHAQRCMLNKVCFSNKNNLEVNKCLFHLLRNVMQCGFSHSFKYVMEIYKWLTIVILANWQCCKPLSKQHYHLKMAKHKLFIKVFRQNTIFLSYTQTPHKHLIFFIHNFLFCLKKL